MKDMIDLLRKNEKDVCVTIVQSGKLKSFDDKEKALVGLRKIIASTKKVLNAEYGEEVAERLVKELNAQILNLDFGKARKTLVIYATGGFGKSVWLPFMEKERLTIRSSFDLQPLRAATDKERDFWVLALSKNKTRLFRGKNENLDEVIDDNFPLAYEEQFQYEKQRYSQSNNPGTYSPRDSKVDMERQHAFFRHIDHLLKPHLEKENFPIVLLGVKSNLSEFNHKSAFAGNIVKQIQGNFDYHSSGQIAKKVWMMAKDYIQTQIALK